MSLFNFHSSTLLYRVISIICQTLVYGIYSCLFPISVYVMLYVKLYNRSRMVLFVTMVITFALSTIYWVLSVVVTFLVIRAWFSELDPATHSAPTWLPMLSAILLVNLIVTDGVVVWRAWVICSDVNKAILMTPVLAYFLLCFSYVTVVAARVGLLITPEGAQSHQDLARIIDVAQVGNLALSLLTNVLATSIIAVKSWMYRKSLISYNVRGQTSTLASKVMGLLVESGMLYILIGATVLASCVIRLPFGTLGDIITPVGVQLAVRAAFLRSPTAVLIP
ncbi:hypothetical protein DFH94DRAFT_627208 [Russula ochroleuca]|uniref:Uncharacterized protein n=1 Tax=Russula ochroleuca TaxID=152965 RepID=A0A9P5N0D2_9AGAM|nr:hypothetical protein DFH94DRAFT_627208 [Russula ochroleuca]